MLDLCLMQLFQSGTMILFILCLKYLKIKYLKAKEKYDQYIFLKGKVKYNNL